MTATVEGTVVGVLVAPVTEVGNCSVRFHQLIVVRYATNHVAN